MFLFISVSLFAVDARPEGDCGFRTKWDSYINLSGKVRIVGSNEMADVYVRVWHSGDHIPSGTPEMTIKIVDKDPDWCGEFQIVDKNEDFTVKLVNDGNCADIVIVLGEPRKSYPQGVAF